MKIQNGASAPTGSACLEKAMTMTLGGSQLEQIHAAGEAYRRLFELRAIGAEWLGAYAEWRGLAEALAITLIKRAEQLEARHD